MADIIDFNHLAEVIASQYKEAAIVLPGPPLQIFGQRAAPTIVLKSMQQKEGKFYYECKTITGGYMQIGWADTKFSAVIAEGKGCGDDAHSWGYDGYRCLKWHANQKESFGRKWKPGDVIGIAVDLEPSSNSIRFSLNGDWQSGGVAFEDIKIDAGVYPCITLLRGERVELNIGTPDNPFAFKPPTDDYSRLTITQPMAELKAKESRYSGSTNIIEMGMHAHAFTVSFPGEIMVNMMRRGLDYEAKKNAMIHAGYEATLKRWERVKEKIVEKIKGINLTENEIHALICYTLEDPPVYRYFNSDTRQGYKADGDDFPIISHLLREGCRKVLASVRKSPSYTKTVYRCVDLEFKTKIGEMIRLGSFTSTSGCREVSESFRKDAKGTLLVIKTKIGAPIAALSVYPGEDEVLIPPYEVFKVVKIEDATDLKIYLESIVEDDNIDQYVKTGAITWNS
eukprot:gene7357-8177_t